MSICIRSSVRTTLLSRSSFGPAGRVLFARSFSSLPTPSPLRSSALTVERSNESRTVPPPETLKFGATMSDHMLDIDWTLDGGWAAPVIHGYRALSLDPAASSLHYGLQLFEGMKAYVAVDGTVRLFRPDMNMARMNASARRLLLPEFDGGELVACIKRLILEDRKWIPSGRGYSLYIRPTLISTHAYLGVQRALRCKLFVITGPVGPYYPNGFAPIKLYADPVHVRAWPGGTGAAKCGGNYALGIKPAYDAFLKKYDQVLWLFGPERYVTEVGTMNQFFFIRNKRSGRDELITAPLDGTILPGVTRDSVLALARSWREFDVSERNYTLDEVIEAVRDGRIIEAFGVGTAAVVAPVNAIAYGDEEFAIPLDRADPTAKAGKLAARLSATLNDIQYGVTQHEWSVKVEQT